MRTADSSLLYALLIIGVVSAAAGAGTFAFFNDTEVAQNNTFTAGTIDIAVDDQNPWQATYTIGDMKPSFKRWINFTIQNNGTNPTHLYKHLNVTNQSDAIHTEPEDVEDPDGTRNDIASVIDYSLRIEVTDENGTAVRNATIFTQTDGVTVTDVNSSWIDLGTLQPGHEMHVTQDYHMQSDVTNWAQGDRMTFDIEVMADQLNAPQRNTVN